MATIEAITIKCPQWPKFSGTHYSLWHRRATLNFQVAEFCVVIDGIAPRPATPPTIAHALPTTSPSKSA